MASDSSDEGISWSDDFLIGIEELDFEHRRLIEDINELHQELLAQVDVAQIGDTLSRILSRMQAHFALEEHVMLSHKYPQYAEHKAEHERLLDDYTDLMTKCERDRALPERANIERVLRHWIVDHIVTTDRKMSLMVTGRSPRGT